MLPLGTTDTVAGVLVIMRRNGARGFTDDQLDMMSAFADRAAAGLAVGQHPAPGASLDLLSDRDRIARDLHDHVIQRLFAVGLSLQGTIPRTSPPEVAARLVEAVDDLQSVIQEIRTAIFDLHGGGSGQPDSGSGSPPQSRRSPGPGRAAASDSSDRRRWSQNRDLAVYAGRVRGVSNALRRTP